MVYEPLVDATHLRFFHSKTCLSPLDIFLHRFDSNDDEINYKSYVPVWVRNHDLQLVTLGYHLATSTLPVNPFKLRTYLPRKKAPRISSSKHNTMLIFLHTAHLTKGSNLPEHWRQFVQVMIQKIASIATNDATK